jgi:hypothetical protein
LHFARRSTLRDESTVHGSPSSQLFGVDWHVWSVRSQE